METRPSNAFHQKPTEVPVLHRSTPFSWHFSADDRHDLRIFCSARGTFDLCRRVQIGAMCWETLTLASHQTLEEAVAAAEALTAVLCR